MLQCYRYLFQTKFMLTPASTEQELNIITTVAYKCCADHSIYGRFAVWQLTAPDGTGQHRTTTAPGQKWLITSLRRRIKRHKMS